jgi:glyceraldehyde-3-phosphate dehydrogenase/erythrose-4-phosphate dehydrogenase
MTRIAINGFGRIGRNVLRALLERDTALEVVAVNDLTEPAALARLLAFDSTAGRLGRPVSVDGDTLVVDGRRIKVLAEREPAQLPWAELGVDIVLEATGRFTSAKAARAHLDAGARKVLVSAPSDGADVTLAYGVNTDVYDAELSGDSIRVPVPVGSIVELNTTVSRDVTRDEVLAAYRAAAEGPLAGVLEYSEDPLVSSDITGNPASSIFDSALTRVDGRHIKVVAWYDNEWGFSNRVIDTLELLARG